MIRIITSLIGFIMLFSLSACNSSSNSTTVIDDSSSITIPLEDTTPITETKEDGYMNKTMELKIDNQVIDAIWLIIYQLKP